MYRQEPNTLKQNHKKGTLGEEKVKGDGKKA
jgi:hypothetical protein